jgi:benzil reductase ((S)-benzoin forming)
MSIELTILTGHSRGMGRCLTELLLAQDHHVLGISRRRAEGLRASDALTEWQADLSEGEPVARQLQSWLAQQGAQAWSRLTLINNAGLIPEIVPLSRARPEDLETPMQLCAAFLAATRDWPVPRRILNVSSGLGRRPMASQSAYCAAKAGMDHFTRCLALEEARMPHGAKVCSLAPGVIDTDMQAQLRSAPQDQFPDRAGFAGMHDQGQLASPQAAAERLLAYLARPDFGQQPVADVRG